MRGLIARPKLYIAVACALAACLLLPAWLPSGARAAAVWDVGGIVYIALAVGVFRSCDVDQTRRRAAGEEDQARLVFLLLILAATAASFASTVAFDRRSQGRPRRAVGTVQPRRRSSCSTVTQIVFMLHYAHADHQPVPGSSDYFAASRSRMTSIPTTAPPPFHHVDRRHVADLGRRRDGEIVATAGLHSRR